jgi:hypothetical protein
MRSAYPGSFHRRPSRIHEASWCHAAAMAQDVCPLIATEDPLISRRSSPIASSRPRRTDSGANRAPLGRAAGARRGGWCAGVGWPAGCRWQRRFAEAGVDTLVRDATRKPAKPPLRDEVIRRVVALTCAEPPVRQRTGPAGRWPTPRASPCARCRGDRCCSRPAATSHPHLQPLQGAGVAVSSRSSSGSISIRRCTALHANLRLLWLNAVETFLSVLAASGLNGALPLDRRGGSCHQPTLPNTTTPPSRPSGPSAPTLSSRT